MIEIHHYNAKRIVDNVHYCTEDNVTCLDEKHGKSARMDVQDPKTDSVYITRLIPVTPGMHYVARCDIKTKDVTVAEGKMASVGACLIVEWADKDR